LFIAWLSVSFLAERPGCVRKHHPGQWWHQTGVCSIQGIESEIFSQVKLRTRVSVNIF
jgi:hypothetical protein